MMCFLASWPRRCGWTRTALVLGCFSCARILSQLTSAVSLGPSTDFVSGHDNRYLEHTRLPRKCAGICVHMASVFLSTTRHPRGRGISENAKHTSKPAGACACAGSSVTSGGYGTGAELPPTKQFPQPNRDPDRFLPVGTRAHL